ncbi:hypothetical protein BGZ72_011107 [Mortierella alpina]|nr:hypothetical protein BGZ72_011107 [Mortierella alpina]
MEALELRQVMDITGDTTTRATVFDISLLVDIIARHLTTRDIYNCSLVSHQLHNAFQHRLYSCINIRKQANLDMFVRKEATNAFFSYLSYVKEFSTGLGECVKHVTKKASLQCPHPSAPGPPAVLFRNLTVFRFLPTRELRDYELYSYSTSILSLLEASPTLQVLDLSRFAAHTQILNLAKIIRAKGRQLKEVRINEHRSIRWTHFFMLLWSCAAVEVLHIGLGQLPPDSEAPVAEIIAGLKALAQEALSSKIHGPQPAQSGTARISDCFDNADRMEFAWKELRPGRRLFGYSYEMIQRLLQMCPYLETMVIPSLTEQVTVSYLAPLVAKSLPQLRHLDLTLISDQSIGICRLVQACKGLISLNMGRLAFDSPGLVEAVVSGHGHSLQSLHIKSFTELSSQELNLILSSCPRLKSLYALSTHDDAPRHTVGSPPVLNTKDMAMVPKEPGWICRDLETLHLCYISEDTTIGIPEVLWRQIGQLSKLNDLRLCRYASGGGQAVQEKATVRQALLSWVTLSDLRRLELRAMKAFVDEQFVGQVKDQWAHLEWVL